MKLRTTVLICAFSAVTSAGAAELRPAGIFTDHMVLQRGAQVPVWGTSEAEAHVTVTFCGQSKSAVADRDGRWTVTLDPMTASAEPRELSIRAGDRSVTLTDVLVGEVWLASGQSNMALAVRKSAEADEMVRTILDPRIRYFSVAYSFAERPADELLGDGVVEMHAARRTNRWQAVSSESIGAMSAVAAWFAHDLESKLDVPVGIIQSVFGGSRAECWIPAEVLRTNPEFNRDIIEKYARDKAAFTALHAAWRADPNRKTQTEPRDPWIPACLWNAMIEPLAPYAIKGVIWYQGESNTGYAEQYRRLLPALVTSWRSRWGCGDFPFIAVQLPGIGVVRNHPKSAVAEMRESIALIAKAVPNATSIVINDCGVENEIHPPSKQAVGHRLALAARGLAYGEEIEWRGPTYRRLELRGAEAVVYFEHVGRGLTTQGGPLAGFTLAGADQQFVSAEAEIRGDAVVVRSAAVPHPAAVRYAWADFPVANLWNRDGLTAGTFRTDDWPMLTKRESNQPNELQTVAADSPPAGTEYELDPSRKFWLPSSVGPGDKVRAVFVHVHAEDVERGENDLYLDATDNHIDRPWRRLAAEMKCGLMVIGYAHSIGEMLTWAAERTGHPEIQFAPYTESGLSNNGWRRLQDAARSPDRIVAVFPFHGFDPSKSLDFLKDPQWAVNQKRIPVLDIFGGADVRRNDVIRQEVEAVRTAVGGPWSACLQPNVVHTEMGDQEFITTWLREVLMQRLPETVTGTSPPVLRELNQDDAWLGTFTLGREDGPEVFAGKAYLKDPAIFPASEYTGPIGKTIYLPSKDIAMKWLSYSKTGKF